MRQKTKWFRLKVRKTSEICSEHMTQSSKFSRIARHSDVNVPEAAKNKLSLVSEGEAVGGGASR